MPDLATLLGYASEVIKVLNLIESVQLSLSNVSGNTLIDIYGKGMGLVRSLEHDQLDQVWSRK